MPPHLYAASNKALTSNGRGFCFNTLNNNPAHKYQNACR